MASYMASDFSLHWERFGVLLNNAYTNFKDKVAIIFSFYLINSLFLWLLPFIFLFSYLFIYLFTYLFIYLFTYLFIYLFLNCS